MAAVQLWTWCKAENLTCCTSVSKHLYKALCWEMNSSMAEAAAPLSGSLLRTMGRLAISHPAYKLSESRHGNLIWAKGFRTVFPAGVTPGGSLGSWLRNDELNHDTDHSKRRGPHAPLIYIRNLLVPIYIYGQ